MLRSLVGSEMCIRDRYDKAYNCVKNGVPISKAKNDELFYKITTMKYNVSEDKLEMFDELINEIDSFYDSLKTMYGREVSRQ